MKLLIEQLATAAETARAMDTDAGRDAESSINETIRELVLAGLAQS